LDLIRGTGVEPEIVLYLEDVPSSADITDALRMLGMKPQELLRRGEPEFKEYFEDVSEMNDKEIIERMRRYPKVIERPIVINEGKAIIGRPPENALSIL
jgi:arsenate reductase